MALPSMECTLNLHIMIHENGCVASGKASVCCKPDWQITTKDTNQRNMNELNDMSLTMVLGT